MLSPDAAPVAPLTDAQRAWVQQRGRIHVGFVGPLLRVPTVIVAAGDQFLGEGLDGRGARRVALLRQRVLLPVLRSHHPVLRVVEFDTKAEVLQAVRQGEADLAIGNMKVVNLLLEQHHQGALKTGGIVPQGDSELYFAVPRAQPELSAVLRSALDAITPAERHAIENRWLKVEFSAGIPRGRALAIAAAVLLAAGLVVASLWVSNRRLAAATKADEAARRAAEEQGQARVRFTAYLSHELRGTLGGLRGGLAMLEAGTLLDLCERTLDIERWLGSGGSISSRCRCGWSRCSKARSRPGACSPK